jgi:XTP/dITP diphosphohydrolase
MKLLLATTNLNKVREIRPLLAGIDVQLVTLADLPAMLEPEETAPAYWQNARLKAFGYARGIQKEQRAVVPPDTIVVAEDSGLEIAGLGGLPGVHSARFLGPNVSYSQRFAEIYRRLDGLPNHARDARFITALAAVTGDEVVFESESAIEGVITREPAGSHGFGYDPIFFYRPLGKTTAELTLEEKCIVSHRARAFRDFVRWLRHTKLA